MATTMQALGRGDATDGQNGIMHTSVQQATGRYRGQSNGHDLAAAPSASPAAAAIVEPVVVEALYPYTGDEQNHLWFSKGDLIEVWGREASGWWDGILIKSRSHERGARGWFPSSE